MLQRVLAEAHARLEFENRRGHRIWQRERWLRARRVAVADVVNLQCHACVTARLEHEGQEALWAEPEPDSLPPLHESVGMDFAYISDMAGASEAELEARHGDPNLDFSQWRVDWEDHNMFGYNGVTLPGTDDEAVQLIQAGYPR